MGREGNSVFELVGSRLLLYDVVASELPALDALLSELSSAVDRVQFHFSPDRFGIDARPEPFRFDDDYYMVRGPFAAESKAFMVPTPARH